MLCFKKISFFFEKFLHEILVKLACELLSASTRLLSNWILLGKIFCLWFDFVLSKHSVCDSFHLMLTILTYLSPMHPFSTPWKHQKPYSFLMFSWGRKKMRWEQNGLICSIDIGININYDRESMKLGVVIKKMDW